MNSGDTTAAAADTGQPTIAGLGQRFLALLGDWLLCLLLAGGLTRMGVLAATDPGAALGPGQIWPSLILVAEYSFFLAFSSQTPGMWLLRIHCVRVDSGRHLGLPRAVGRAVLLAVVLPALTALFDPRRRGLHDMLAGSIMLRGRGPATAA